MNLQEISWPVFRLGERQPLIDGDIIYYINESVNTDTNIIKTRVRFVDDKSIDKPSVGARRLVMKKQGAPMFTITKAVYFIGDLIKLSKTTTWFIDNAGHTFQYKKAMRAKLTCHKVRQVLPAKGMGAVVELEGVPSRFKILYAPSASQGYAGILHLGLGNIIYGFYEEPFKATTRAV